MRTLTNSQIERLTKLFQQGAEEASRALSIWLGRHANVFVDRLEELSFEAATTSLGPADATMCACVMALTGGITGQIMFCFDDRSGLSLCDQLLGRDRVSFEWGEIETSSAMETANIVGCAYLNSLSVAFPALSKSILEIGGPSHAWLPSPPQFVRDYAASILQFAVMNQAVEFETVLLAQTRFQIDDTPVAWRLLLIPDSSSLDLMTRSIS